MATTGTQNHRIVVSRRGGPNVLLVVEEDLPRPQTHEVRIRVSAAGVSAYDVLTRSFWFPGNPTPPFTPGEDLVGVVDEVGAGVTELVPGQLVAGWTFGDGGAYAEYVCRPVDQLVAVPAGLDPAEAVTVVINYLTAHLSLHLTAKVRSGERILVHGAAGGLGTALLQLGAIADLEMYGTASQPNQELVSALGATPIDYRNEDFVERIRTLTGDGVDVVFDTVSGPRQLWRSYRCLRRGGRLVPIGSVATNRGGMKVIPLSLAAIGALKLFPDRKRVPLSPNMMSYPEANLDWYRNTLAELLELTTTGAIKPVIAGRIPLRNASAAHELLADAGRGGKYVLTASQ